MDKPLLHIYTTYDIIVWSISIEFNIIITYYTSSQMNQFSRFKYDSKLISASNQFSIVYYFTFI